MDNKELSFEKAPLQSCVYLFADRADRHGKDSLVKELLNVWTRFERS